MTSKTPYKEPSFGESAFNCPLCNAYANQSWPNLYYFKVGYLRIEDLGLSFCFNCGRYSIWYQEILTYPNFSQNEQPNSDLDQDIKDDYAEAADILNRSPRGSAALLRLAIQKLCRQLGEKGEDLNTDIGNLVKKGLPLKVQQSLDSVRVIGNEAVHPGELNLKDDKDTALALFKLLNFIAEKMITEPKEIDAIYNKIPETKKKQIEERDRKGGDS